MEQLTAGQLRKWLENIADNEKVAFFVDGKEHFCSEAHVAEIDNEHLPEYWIHLEVGQ